MHRNCWVRLAEVACCRGEAGRDMLEHTFSSADNAAGLGKLSVQLGRCVVLAVLQQLGFVLQLGEVLAYLAHLCHRRILGFDRLGCRSVTSQSDFSNHRGIISERPGFIEDHI